MANRTFTLPGIWASTATTTIPTPPIAGVTYRSTSLAGVIADGWPFSRVVASEDMNQLLWLATQLLAQLEAQGILSWASSVSYGTGALAFGSDGQLYQSILRIANSNNDPTISPTCWSLALGIQDGSVTGAKLANRAVTAAKATRLLGTFQSGLVFNQVYQAATDGFVVAYTNMASGMLAANVGATSAVSTLLTELGLGGGHHCLTFPVQRDMFWKVSRSGSSSDAGLSFMPLGS